MKNAMKKLLSLVLAAMLLVSVVPMGAMAADGFTVNVEIKDENGVIEGKTDSRQQKPGDAYTAGDYLNSVYPGWDSTYEVSKVWIKNADTGSDGTNIDLSNTITKDTHLVIKLVHKDITVKFDVYQDGNYKYTNTRSYAYGTKLTLNAALASDAGVPGAESIRCDAKGLSMGNTLTVDGTVNVQVVLPASEQPTNPPATEKKSVTMIVKIDGQDNQTFPIELNGDSAPLSDLLYYHFDKAWKNTYNFVRANKNGETFTDLSTLVYAGEEVSVRLEKKNSETKPTEPSVDPVHYVIKLDSSNNVLAEGDKTPTNGKYLVVKDLLKYWSSNWDGNYDFSHAQIKGSDKNIGLDGTVSAGKTVYIMLESEGGSGSGDTSKYWTVYFNDADNNVIHSVKVKDGSKIGTWDAEEARDEVKNDKKGYTFEGWRLNGAGNILSTNTIAHTTVKTSLSYYPVYSKNGSDSDKLNSNKVKLHIFLDNRVTNPAKDIDITDGIAKDGVVTQGEAKDVVKKYYSAKNDDGIGYDGLYFATGSWVGQFVKDEKVDRIDNIDDLKKEGYVHINIMVNNAKAKTNSNADSSNPKTGDDIYMTVTVMGLSAAALCAVYYISKKRAVR